MPRRDEARAPYSYVDAETTVEGTLTAGDRLRVDGHVRAEVSVGGVLEVAPGGRIEGGPVRAGDVRIAGAILADVQASGTVEVWNGGRLEGDVRAASLDIEEGATFLGRSLSAQDASQAPAHSAISASAGDTGTEPGSDGEPNPDPQR